MPYYLGVDVGGTKTHAVIADERGTVVGFGRSGPGNHESVGYDGLENAIRQAIMEALEDGGIGLADLAGGGFGVAGYDWPYEKRLTEDTIRKLGVKFPFTAVNDTIPGLVAGSHEGWGVVLISGTGCNCRGWDKDHKREAYAAGAGYLVGENAGATELVVKAMQAVTMEWAARGPKTALTRIFMEKVGAGTSEDLVEGYTQGRYGDQIGAPFARLIFDAARKGDKVSLEIVTWAGKELGDMACGVIRKLDFEDLDFDVVLSGSMFDGGPLMIEPLRETIQAVAPGAKLHRLTVPPVVGAVLIGMEEAGLEITDDIRAELARSIADA